MDIIKKIRTKGDTVVVSISMKKSELEKVNEIVKKEKIGRSELIRTLLMDFVEKYNKN